MSDTASTPTRTGGVLAVHAHPDDETLSTGALLATWAAAGLPATVVTCTRGERGEVIGARWAALEGDGEALARHRERELAAAVASLGATQHFLDALPLPADLADLADPAEGGGGRAPPPAAGGGGGRGGPTPPSGQTTSPPRPSRGRRLPARRRGCRVRGTRTPG
ncbi:PIG-L deacetylase family protein [Cellulomonas sp. PS-H5]|uniref:PIG-L deacetylase family protein n=1 Tax=Cellulomonas sp. PS-H5 TaxID=2820400 RepID=UPI001C4F4FCA|nr:PIG-L family deacetylase [Cellulomonas sp. PS-H5]MBW0253823.1 PIG-L family deacetylase [Cellulomonas sp. PS-H5]